MSRQWACIAGLFCNHHHRTGGDFCSSCRYAQVHLREPGFVLVGAAVAFQQLGKRLRILFHLLAPLRVAHHRLYLWGLRASVLGRRLLLAGPPSPSWIGRPPSSKRGVAPHGVRPRFQVNFLHRPRSLRHQVHVSRLRPRWLGGRTRCAGCRSLAPWSGGCFFTIGSLPLIFPSLPMLPFT